MNNGNGRRIQIIAWNDDIDNIESVIQTNCVSVIIDKNFINIIKYILYYEIK